MHSKGPDWEQCEPTWQKWKELLLTASAPLRQAPWRAGRRAEKEPGHSTAARPRRPAPALAASAWRMEARLGSSRVTLRKDQFKTGRKSLETVRSSHIPVLANPDSSHDSKAQGCASADSSWQDASGYCSPCRSLQGAKRAGESPGWWHRVLTLGRCFSDPFQRGPELKCVSPHAFFFCFFFFLLL